jgi:pyrophosphatase PpaX
VKAVLWDLDDTILDTLPARMRSLRHAHQVCLGADTDPLELWRSHRGGTLEALGKRLMGEEWTRFAETYRAHYYNQDRPHGTFDGVREVLDAIRGAGLLMGIVTSKISWGATEELDRAGLLHYFGAIVGHDDVERAKPDPDPIFEAMSRILIDDPADVVFIGDTPADISAGLSAGCLAVAATWGTLDEPALLAAGPHHVARTPSAILEIVGLSREVPA